MIKLTKERILLLYKMMVEATGGTYGVREESLLESAIASPYQTFDGKEMFPSKLEKAARLGYGLIVNHPFIDGNKRLGIYIMLVFLEVNGIKLKFTDKEIEDIALGVARSEMKYEEILLILENKGKK